MTLIPIDDIKSLIKQPDSFCVSIYMPTYKTVPEFQQNPIRFKNLIRTAHTYLTDNGYTAPQAAQFLQPLQDEIEADDEFWQHQGDGLALFMTEGFYRYYRLPVTVQELTVVTDQFHLKPLLALLSHDVQFYILTLSQHQVRLLEASHYSIEEIQVEGLPASMAEALQYDETAKDGQFRISTSKGGTNNSFQHAGSFHGQGSPDRDDIRQDLLQYFHLIDGVLHEFLREKKAPLILAGVEYLMPIYQEANTYPHLVAAGIMGNPEHLPLEALHQQGWAIAEPICQQAQADAIERYRELAGSQSQKISTDLTEAVPAAYYGRVDQLFVAVGVQKWGSFDPMANEVHIHPEAQPGDEDLLDAAAIQTLLNGGKVFAVPPDQVPDDAPLAAVFRY